MPLLIKFLSNALVQQLVLGGLQVLVKRSDNTVDDQVVRVVEQALANRLDPIKRVVGK